MFLHHTIDRNIAHFIVFFGNVLMCCLLKIANCQYLSIHDGDIISYLPMYRSQLNFGLFYLVRSADDLAIIYIILLSTEDSSR